MLTISSYLCYSVIFAILFYFLFSHAHYEIKMTQSYSHTIVLHHATSNTVIGIISPRSLSQSHVIPIDRTFNFIKI